MSMDYLDRLEQEYKDIREKIGALTHYLEYGNHANLNDGEKRLLTTQYATMEAYLSVLYQRKRLVAKGFSNSKGKVMEEGKTIAELYAVYRSGVRDL